MRHLSGACFRLLKNFQLSANIVLFADGCRPEMLGCFPSVHWEWLHSQSTWVECEKWVVLHSYHEPQCRTLHLSSSTPPVRTMRLLRKPYIIVLLPVSESSTVGHNKSCWFDLSRVARACMARSLMKNTHFPKRFCVVACKLQYIPFACYEEFLAPIIK